MRSTAPQTIEAQRLPELYRAVCGVAGIPLPSPRVPLERFIVRSGPEQPHLYAELLEEAFAEDEAEIAVDQPDNPVDLERLGPGAVMIRPGFDFPCPDPEALRLVISRIARL